MPSSSSSASCSTAPTPSNCDRDSIGYFSSNSPASKSPTLSFSTSPIDIEKDNKHSLRMIQKRLLEEEQLMNSKKNETSKSMYSSSTNITKDNKHDDTINNNEKYQMNSTNNNLKTSIDQYQSSKLKRLKLKQKQEFKKKNSLFYILKGSILYSLINDQSINNSTIHNSSTFISNNKNESKDNSKSMKKNKKKFPRIERNPLVSHLESIKSQQKQQQQ
jgi:hypothetical protein